MSKRTASKGMHELGAGGNEHAPVSSPWGDGGHHRRRATVGLQELAR